MKFLNKLRFPMFFGQITGTEGEVWYDTDKHQPRFINADASVASFAEGIKFNRYTTGRWYSTQLGAPNTTNATANRAFAIPFSLTRYSQISGIALEVSTAWTTTGNVRVGIYSDNGFATPNNRLLDSGAVAATAGIKTWSASLDLAAGMYWLVGANQGGSGATTGQFRSVIGLQEFIGDPSATPTSTFFNGSINSYYSDTGFSGAFPASFGTVAGIALGPRFLLRFSS
jgi:hypothetical protein